jgi:hypothetical protein
MPRKLLALLLFAAGVAFAAPTWASGDFTCQVSWTLKETERSDCDNQPFLAPGNDSRVNLQLLLLDAGKISLHPAGQPQSAQDRWPAPAGPVPFTIDDLNGLIDPPPPAAPGADAAPDRADGEGSRCNSNAAGADQFQAALNASALPADERAALAAARAGLQPKCVDGSKTAAPPGPPHPRSPLGQQFAAYLTGAAAFYAGDYDTAAHAFAGLKSSQSPWLKETARYMAGRVELNRAQAGAFGEYGDLQVAKVDAKAVAAAGAAFQAYLRDYPNGAYAVSARGLMRRVAWLGGRPADLGGAFVRAFDATSPKARNVSETALVQEADAKLLTSADGAEVREPLLLASYDLIHMRNVTGSDGTTVSTPITLAALQAQRPVFAGHEALFDYLLAAHAFYDDHDPAAVLARLPAEAPHAPMTYLSFSRQLLRGLALEATKDPAGARALWLGLMPAVRPPFQHATLELALAMNYERGGALAQVFAPGSPIQDADIRELLLNNAAGPALLRQRAKAADAPEHERRVALYALLYKQLTRGRYAGFLADLSLAPTDPPVKPDVPDQRRPDPDFALFHAASGHDGYPCPTIRETAGALVKDPQSGPALVCLNEFVRLNGLDDAPLDIRPPADELGGAPSQFPGGVYSRQESYQRLLANPKTAANERAYVLYRAVECYAPSGANHCTGKDVPLAQRKAWYHTLKTDYPASPWAQRLKYFW